MQSRIIVPLFSRLFIIIWEILEILCHCFYADRTVIVHDIGGTSVTQVITPQILNCNASKTFWIQWTSGNITVGQNDIRTPPIVAWSDPNPHPVNFLSLAADNGRTMGGWFFGQDTGVYILYGP
jgi:Farnesoic acid 0-methyl transferase